MCIDLVSKFERLERYVVKLLAQYDQLLEENLRLRKSVEQKEEEIKALQVEVNSADTERGDISSRIKALIDQIEEWESAISEPTVLPEKDSIIPEESAESADTAQEDTEDMDQERKQQRNLFTANPSSTGHGG